MQLEFENSAGESIVLGPYPYKIVNGGGEDETEVDNQWQKSPYQDGETFIDNTLENGVHPYEIVISANSPEQLQERKEYLCKVLNPKKGLGRLRKIEAGTTREKDVVSDFVPKFPKGTSNRAPGFQRCLIQWTGNPYWQSLEVVAEPLSAFVPKFQFPFSFPVKFGERGSEANLYNDGHVPCPIEIEFNGPAVNPMVTNRATGEFLRVTQELNEGDKLLINTAEGRDRQIIIQRQNGDTENAWHYIDIWDSTLFYLDIGENVIEYDATAGGTALVNISFRKLYVGV
ncbi:phage distal tail protein [Salipaludibacillus aurantiacus]|uniref:Phage tail protein n=1 Tax=Salipaludibacillus aurantiacus TaxID=1601833 RepID=A0A1H9TZH9_9BACI|nr:phage tail domain-containing protein [Salipaludibacillus aurantiacus]SES02576.1 Phage tail protein [Salipaludibacillus aurantiacus]